MKTIARFHGSWLTTTDFQQRFNDSNNVLNTARTGIHFRKAEKIKVKASTAFDPSTFFYSEEFMKKSITSLIYVYRLLNRQVVSGARGVLNRGT